MDRCEARIGKLGGQDHTARFDTDPLPDSINGELPLHHQRDLG